MNRVPYIRENVEASKYGKMEPSCHACNGHTPQVTKIPAYHIGNTYGGQYLPKN